MDNEDNDYQGQNSNLVGSESSKIYSLPKFDFDDNLQVHSRFDGLIENEVFLGIPSQEDNHWMEDFSRGNSGIEFSSSATESCSIPRNNNVWGEATSLESVDLLLKSVVQEEMVPHVIETSNGSSEKEIEPSLVVPDEQQITLIDDSNVTDEHLSSTHTQLNDASMVEPTQEYGVETGPTKCEEDSSLLPETVLVAEKEVIETSNEKIDAISSIDCEVNDLCNLTNMPFSAENNDDGGVQSEVAPSVEEGIQESMDNNSSDNIIVIDNDPDVPVLDKEDAMNVDSEVVELIDDEKTPLPSSSLNKEVIEKVDGLISDAKTLLPSSPEKEILLGPPPGFELLDPTANESVSNADVDNTNLISSEISDMIPLISPMSVEKVSNPSRVVVISDEDDDENLESGAQADSETPNPNFKESLCVEGDKSLETASKDDETIQEEIDAADEKIQESIDVINLDPVDCGSQLADAENDVSDQDTKEENFQDQGNLEESEPSQVGPTEAELIKTETSTHAGPTEAELSKTDTNAHAGPTESELLKTETSAHAGPTEASLEKVALSMDTPISKPSDDLASVIEMISKTEKSAQVGPTESGMEDIVISAGPTEAVLSERSFTFDVRPLTEVPKGYQNFPSIKDCNLAPMTEKESASEGKTGKDSGKKVVDIVKDTQTPVTVRENKQCTLESSSGTGIANAERSGAKQCILGISPVASNANTERSGAKQCMFEISPGSGNANTGRSGAKKLLERSSGSGKGGANKERSGAKSPYLVSAPGSKLPDLNTSVLFLQPFTDLQQIQLRAQILVYGNLIQGAAPDENHMVSAFGTSDGGNRMVWENSWRACMERLRAQKSINSNYATTPVQSRAGGGSKAPQTKVTPSPAGPQTKVTPSTAGRLSSKVVTPPPPPSLPLPGVNISSSPLWNISTPPSSAVGPTRGGGGVVDYQALPPLHTYHTPPMRAFTGRTPTNSWISQPQFPAPPFAGPSFDYGPRFPSFPSLSSPLLIDPSGGSGPSSNKKRTAPSPSPSPSGGILQASATTPKPRKRKKSNDPVVGPVGSSSAKIITPPPILTPHFSTAVSVPAPPPITTPQSKGDDSRKVEEAKRFAIEASKDAESAVTHCQNVWAQLGKSGLTKENELKLASAAVSIAAAASVAKAAAAAAKIASNAAFIANEALIKGCYDSSKRAENLNAILKAAELAKEAVAQAGKVVNMGENLSLSELVEAGPDKYWRESEEIVKANQQSDQGGSSFSISIEIPRNVEENNVVTEEEEEEEEDKETADPKESDTSISNEYGMKEGSLVEVYKDGGCFKGAWYSANVLSLENGKVFVCYTELQSEQGSALLREWVPLEGKGSGEIPIIRVPHPMSSMRLGRTRKRRRAVREYDWSVGDRVDAWIEDCWREGIVKEKNKPDETTLTVHFPVQKENTLVRAWHLRPTLTWKNGEWIELASSQENTSSQGDMPLEKRQKLGTPEVKGKGKEIVGSAKVNEPKPLSLTTSEKVFNIGGNNNNYNNKKGDGPRVMRSGLQKEGSKVIYGVPKPKRKFMEMSKTYDVSEGSTTSSKILVPQGGGSRGWNISKSSKPIVKENQVGGEVKRFRKLPHKGTSSSSDISETRRKRVPGFSSVSKPEGEQDRKVKAERLTKGNLAPAGGRSTTKTEVKEKSSSTSEAVEPTRRSNRKIQPTSRLLEGLQTSLTISKIPSFSSKNHNRGASRGEK